MRKGRKEATTDRHSYSCLLFDRSVFQPQSICVRLEERDQVATGRRNLAGRAGGSFVHSIAGRLVPGECVRGVLMSALPPRVVGGLAGLPGGGWTTRTATPATVRVADQRERERRRRAHGRERESLSSQAQSALASCTGACTSPIVCIVSWRSPAALRRDWLGADLDTRRGGRPGETGLPDG